jgi:hypothetical protein
MCEICTSVRDAAHHADALGTELSLSMTDYETTSRVMRCDTIIYTDTEIPHKECIRVY